MSKKMMKGIASTCLAAIALCSVGCGGGSGGDSSKITEINVLCFDGTAGDDWMREAGKRFAAANEDESFETGKTGVKVNVQKKKNLPYSTLNSDGNDIYFDESKVNPYVLSAKGWVLDISDVVEPIADNISDDLLGRMKGVDGKYYALPSIEWDAGVAYDVDYFENNNLYFADPSETNTKTYKSKFGSGKFIVNADGKKSCGPNGVCGDYDDGLPATLQQYAILCDYIKGKGDNAIILCGSGSQYSFYWTHAIWASLAGSEAMGSIYCNYGENGVEVEVVTGFSAKEKMFGVDSAPAMPTVETITLTDENGYKAYDMSARYYSLAFLELAYKEGWFDMDELRTSSSSNTNAQIQFINGSKNGASNAMLYDASYWYHEGVEAGAFSKYAKEHPDDPDRNVAFMPMPTQFLGEEVEAQETSKGNTLLNLGSAFIFANKRVASNPGKLRAVKEFLAFLYSETELKTFTETTGLTIPMEYDYDLEKLGGYYKQLNEFRRDSVIVNYASESMRFKKNFDAFSLYYDAPLHRYSVGGRLFTDGYIRAFKDVNGSAKDIFTSTQRTQGTWDAMQV